MKLNRLNTIPQTPDELTAMILEAGRARAYVDISAAGRRKRLSEHDIGLIEQSIVDIVTTIDPRVAEEFKTFEAEPAIAQARALLKEFFAIAKAARIKDIEQQ